MTKRSAPTTPSRSSARETRKTPRFQIDNTPRSSSHARTPMRAAANFKKIIGHRLYDGYYVEYDVELNDGTTMEVTAADFKKCPQILKDYQKEVTGQEEDSREEYVVEKILTHRMVNGKPLFLVQWEGFPHPVWHSELSDEELGNCEGVMRDYRTMLVQAPRNQFKTQLTPSDLKKMATKRNAPSRDEVEVEVTESTPRKTAKKPVISSARQSRTRRGIVVETSEEQQDEDDIPEDRSFDREAQDDDDEDEDEEEKVEQAKNEEKKGGVGWLFNPFNWF